MKKEVSVFWFRRDLRISDNAGLYYALRENLPVLPVFIFDTEILDDLEDRSDARVSFIHDSVSELFNRFTNEGGTMAVLHGNPEDVYRDLFSKYKIKAIYCNKDYEPYARERDGKINDLAKEHGAEFYEFKDHVIFDGDEILNGSNEPYKVFTPYKNKWLEKFEKIALEKYPSEKHLNNLYSEDSFDLPSLEQIGFKRTSIKIPAPEFDREIISQYDQKRNFPAQRSTSKLGIHLRHGTISIRDAVQVGSKLSKTWLNELIWREFYSMILSHFPHVIDKAFKSQYDRVPWRNSKEDFEKWCKGQTGYPIVDAGMRELNKTGFMHNRVRMITASFLTKHLLIDWRWGEQYFAKKLLDYELASNNGGWQWAAGTGTDAQPYFRVFNPSSQQDKFDKDWKYTKKWVPEYGTDRYPKPMVDHKFARERAISTYKEAIN